jgi:NUMOD4 motif/HNH endonuclease
MIEEWRPVADYPDYEISSFGQIRRATDSHNGTGGVVYGAGYILKGRRTKGYRIVSLTDAQGRTRNKTVSVLVCEAFHGPRPTKWHDAAHNDGNKANDTKDNLLWKTRLENNKDKTRHKTMPRGSKHWRTTLTEAQVIEIKRHLREGKLIQAEIARLYSVRQMTITNIKLKVSWGWLEE